MVIDAEFIESVYREYLWSVQGAHRFLVHGQIRYKDSIVYLHPYVFLAMGVLRNI